MNKYTELLKVSNPEKAQKNAFKYLDKNAILYLSNHKNKKYAIYDPYINKYIHFGDIRYEDYTKHLDKERKKRYLQRATNMHGKWKENKYSANNLSINILWN